MEITHVHLKNGFVCTKSCVQNNKKNIIYEGLQLLFFKNQLWEWGLFSTTLSYLDCNQKRSPQWKKAKKNEQGVDIIVNDIQEIKDTGISWVMKEKVLSKTLPPLFLPIQIFLNLSLGELY